MRGCLPACLGSAHLLCLPRLSLCEKALAEYLDMKRLAFPRFYFISSADLLDILSNGTNPQLVSLVLRHLCIFQLSVLSRGKMLSWDSPIACAFLSAFSLTLTWINSNFFRAGFHLSSLRGNMCPACVSSNLVMLADGSESVVQGRAMVLMPQNLFLLG